MGKVTLTAPRVEAFTCAADKSQAFLWDADTPGLGLRATPGGKKTYIFQSRFQGQTVRVTIGSPDVWPVNNRMDRPGKGGVVQQSGAREEARRLQALIDSGRDPREVRKESEAADAAKRANQLMQSVTVQEAWDAYLAERRQFWSDHHYDDHVKLSQAGGKPRSRSEASIGIRPDGKYAVRLEYTCNGVPSDQRVPLEYTACNMGGERAWFACPACHRRCVVLFMRAKRFACQKCQRLAYSSQSEDACGRAWRAQQKCERKLGPNWERPKGMHQATRDRLVDRVCRYEQARDEALAAFMVRLVPGLWPGYACGDPSRQPQRQSCCMSVQPINLAAP